MDSTGASAAGQPRVVIIGAGFGGLAAARKLRRAPVSVTVIDRNNYHLFVPLLYQVAAASLPPADIAVPVREILSGQANASVVYGEVTGIDVAGRTVRVGQRTIPYDWLVLAPGSGQSYFGHDEWAAFAPGLKSLEQAAGLRNRVLRNFEQAEETDDPETRRFLLTHVLIGGGPTGVELAGSLAELIRAALRHDFRRIRPEEARIILIEAQDRLLTAFPARLGRYAAAALTRRGVELLLSAPVAALAEGRVTAGGRVIAAATIVWTAGVAASPLGRQLGVETDRAGRVAVDPYLAVPGLDRVYVIGDLALAKGRDGQPLPGLAQVAKQQGLYVGRALARKARGLPPGPPFRFRNLGNMAVVATNHAIADFGWWRVSGFPAAVLWSVIHIYLLINFRSRLMVSLEWLWAYLTRRRGNRLIFAVPPTPEPVDHA